MPLARSLKPWWPVACLLAIIPMSVCATQATAQGLLTPERARHMSALAGTGRPVQLDLTLKLRAPAESQAASSPDVIDFCQAVAAGQWRCEGRIRQTPSQGLRSEMTVHLQGTLSEAAVSKVLQAALAFQGPDHKVTAAMRLR